MFQNFIKPKLLNIGLVTIGSLNEGKCKICTTDDIGNKYHYLFICDFFRSDRKLYLKPYFYVKPNIRKYREFILPQPMKQRSSNYQNLLQLLLKSFLCRLFFQMIEINYVPIYMKITHIFFDIKGQFPVMVYIPNTIVFHSTLYLCIMSILLHSMFALISYATCEWPEMHSFQQSYVLFCFGLEQHAFVRG